MSFSGTAITRALSALKLSTRRVDRSAELIASAGLSESPTDPSDATGMPGLAPASAEAGDLTAAMTSMLIAQRDFSAQHKVLRTADEMLKESVEVVGRK